MGCRLEQRRNPGRRASHSTYKHAPRQEMSRGSTKVGPLSIYFFSFRVSINFLFSKLKLNNLLSLFKNRISHLEEYNQKFILLKKYQDRSNNQYRVSGGDQVDQYGRPLKNIDSTRAIQLAKEIEEL